MQNSKDSSQIESSIWFLHQRAIYNCRQYYFCLLVPHFKSYPSLYLLQLCFVWPRAATPIIHIRHSVPTKNERKRTLVSQSRRKKRQFSGKLQIVDTSHRRQIATIWLPLLFHQLVPKPLQTLRDHVTILVYRHSCMSSLMSTKCDKAAHKHIRKTGKR